MNQMGISFLTGRHMINAEMSTLQGLSDRVCAGEEGKDSKGRSVGTGRGPGHVPDVEEGSGAGIPFILSNFLLLLIFPIDFLFSNLLNSALLLFVLFYFVL